jgi:hypothetical protein
MVLETFLKWFVPRLLNCGFEKLKDVFKQPLILEAFEKACGKVLVETEALFDSYTLQGLGYSPETIDGENMAECLQKYFDDIDFPRPEQLTEILMRSWQDRKQQLDSSEAVMFFRLSVDEVRPIIEKLARYFFKELCQYPQFRDAYLVKKLQDMSDVTMPLKHVDVSSIMQCFSRTSESLINWPKTLGNDRWIDRPELQTLIERIEANESSTTLLLGTPGCGKSALLSTLGKQLQEKSYAVLAIKADKLPKTIKNSEDLKVYLGLPLSADDCLRFTTNNSKTILLIDQMDALSEIVDLNSERLNILLNLIQNISSYPAVHIISSSRWFEFKHDTRLNSIQAEQLELMPLPWEDVEAVLNESGIDVLHLTQEARQLLVVPLHLKLFIDILSKIPTLDITFTLQGLLEAIWQQRVLIQNGIIGKTELIQIISRKMVDDEDYWIPRALADDYKDALMALERDEVLVPDEAGLRIGFRHKTYFDFARARYFTQGRERLTDYVLDRQDGLFIRPVLLSSLEYLRGADAANYHKELLAIWNHGCLRTHLRSLLTEYLGALDNPDSVEISCLMPVLQDDSKMNRALLSMAGSLGWFTTIKDGRLVDIMSRPPDVVQACIPLLIKALSFARSDVLKLLESYWLPDVRYDRLILNVLQYQKEWDEQAVNIVCIVAKRTNDWSISHIGEVVSQSNPELAPKIVRADLDRKLLDATRKDAEQPIKPPPPADASNEEKQIYALTNEPFKNQKCLLETDLGWYEMSIIAETAPDAFLVHVWPWFIGVLDRIVGDPHPFVLEYRDDHCLGTKLDKPYSREHQPVTALKDAIEKLADTDPEAFLDFVRENETSDYLAVHRLLCQGLLKLVSQHPKIILEYLTADSRRLVIGDFNDCHKESRKLISAVTPHLDRLDLNKLEGAVVTWNRYYRVEAAWTAEDRRHRLKWNREHRLRLLRAFPENCLSEATKKLRSEEERAFPMLRDWDSQIGGFGFVGSAMTENQMEKAEDEEIVNLFQELNDNTGWDHPRRMVDHVGGVIQASRELGSFAEKQPERAVTLLTNFKPDFQETPAGSVIEGLGKASYPSEKLFSVVQDLDSRGFSSNNFRTDVARTLEKRAEKDGGLPDAMLQLMENWLPTHSEPTTDYVQDDKESDDTESILWGYGGIFSYPGGRDLIFEAIAKGYLLRKPSDVSGWAKVIERALSYERHPDVWDIIFMHMPILFNGNRETAINLYDQVLTNYLRSRKVLFEVRSLARILRLVDDTCIVERWLTLIRDNVWRKGPQVFGELLMLYFCSKPGNSWAKEQVWEYLNNSGAIPVQRGIAYTAAANWHIRQCQDVCTDVLVSFANCEDATVAAAISKVFHFGERVPITNEMRMIIQAILKNDKIIMESAETLIGGIEYAISSEPDLVYQICSRFLDAGTDEVKNMASVYASLAEPIVSIALTLHRMPPPYREYGLNLFERLIESNIQEARYALDMLDRRPFNRNSPMMLPRRRRRRKAIKR